MCYPSVPVTIKGGNCICHVTSLLKAVGYLLPGNWEGKGYINIILVVGLERAVFGFQGAACWLPQVPGQKPKHSSDEVDKACPQPLALRNGPFSAVSTLPCTGSKRQALKAGPSWAVAMSRTSFGPTFAGKSHISHPTRGVLHGLQVVIPGSQRAFQRSMGPLMGACAVPNIVSQPSDPRLALYVPKHLRTGAYEHAVWRVMRQAKEARRW